MGGSNTGLLQRLRSVIATAVFALAAACGTLPSSPPLPEDDCSRWFSRLDAAVDAAGVRDAQDERIDGFAGLRVDRFGQATRTLLPFDAWLAHAAALDRSAREAEAANLSRAAFPLDDAIDAPAALARSERCRAAWPSRLGADAKARAALLQRAQVPDRYAVGLRALGLYPLARWPFFAGVNTWQARHLGAIEQWAAAAPPLQRFAPAAGEDVPLVFEIERTPQRNDATLAPFDRFGAPVWREGFAAPQVDTTQPVVYRRRAQALHGGRVLRQDVFTLWFPERPATGRFDLLAGALDGVIVRLTYGPDGATPWMLDTIHACGCYHLFFPAAGVTPRAGAPQHEEWAFVAGTLPRRSPGQRWSLRIASGTHYVTGLTLDDGAAPAQPYAVRDENTLRSLPMPNGAGRRSLYGPDGLVAGSERGERFLFWPMGIASAGAMRQWGHHATAFVGRRHFDDPHLLADRFVLHQSEEPAQAGSSSD
uniref:Lipoprotein n=1 Tax=uncultured bacterium 51 TaxID=1748279 RepID=A0A0U3U8K4_9BACT|nr:hypothetical protein [uncultured bacterium 51]